MSRRRRDVVIAREDDLELLRQFGRPAFAYSGATPHLLPFIHRSRIVDLNAGKYAGLGGGTTGRRTGWLRTSCTRSDVARGPVWVVLAPRP